SNSNRLVEVAKRRGVKAQLIDAASDINPQWLEGVRRVGLTAGASAPEVLVEQVSERLAQYGFTDQRDLDLIREDVRFTLPAELATIAAAPSFGDQGQTYPPVREAFAPGRHQNDLAQYAGNTRHGGQPWRSKSSVSRERLP